MLQEKVSNLSTLDPSILNSLQAEFDQHLTNHQRGEFRFLNKALNEIVIELNAHERFYNFKVLEFRASLEQSQARLDMINRQIENTQRLITKDPNLDYQKGRGPIIWGRIRVKLKGPLPFLLSPLKRLALDQHPIISPLQLQQELAQENLKIESATFKEKVERLNQDQLPNVQMATQNLHKRTGDLLNFCEDIASLSLEAAENYVKFLPERSHKVARDYVERNISSEDVLELFPPFLNHINTLLIDDTAKRTAKRRYGHFLDDNKIPTYQQLLELPPSAQRRFKEFAIHKITTDWAKKGLVNQPQLPDILQIP